LVRCRHCVFSSIGYGAGDRDFKEHANVLRAIVGERTGAPEANTVSVIEANIDEFESSGSRVCARTADGCGRARCVAFTAPDEEESAGVALACDRSA